MGTVYYALNHEKEVAYELGKGNWTYYLGIDKKPMPTRYVLAERILEMFEAGGWADDFDWITYAYRIADGLIGIGPVVELLGDTDDGLYDRYGHYKLVDGRFIGCIYDGSPLKHW